MPAGAAPPPACSRRPSPRWSAAGQTGGAFRSRSGPPSASRITRSGPNSSPVSSSRTRRTNASSGPRRRRSTPCSIFPGISPRASPPPACAGSRTSGTAPMPTRPGSSATAAPPIATSATTGATSTPSRSQGNSDSGENGVIRGDKARSRLPVVLPALPPPCYQGARQRSFPPGDRMRPNNGAIKIVAGNSNPPLADAIAAYLATPLTKAVVRRFADMEIFVEIQENVRGTDVFVIQSTSYPANDNLMELLIIIDALRRASGRRVTAVIPYFGYARQDRKPAPRTPISAKLVSNLITRAGADRVMTLDLHAGQIQGFFDIPKVMVISPDVGGVGRARGLAKRINAPLAIVDKRRERAGESEVMNVIGEVDGYICILVDDIIDSGGTVVNAADALLDKGATEVYAYITHGVLSGGAVARITASRLKELVITDSIQPTQAVKVARNIRLLSVATLIGEAIGRTAAEESVSSLFD